MSKKYIGKTCPYCKTPFVDGDTVVFCSVCDMPHHLSCWQDNQGCTTFGCTGTIKEIIGNDTTVMPSATTHSEPAPTAVAKPAAPATVTPPPAQAEQAEKPIEVLYESKEMVIQSDVPLVLENTALIIDRRKDKLFARCTFRSITDKPIKAVLVEISCQDVWGSTLGEPITSQYLDLKTKRETKFGQTSPIDLPDKTTRRIRVSVKKVLFADDSVVSGGDVLLTMPAPILLSQHLRSKELAAEYARETTPKAQYVPEYTDTYWRCTCGAINDAADDKCHLCDCSKELLNTALNAEMLNTNMVAFVEQKRVAEERAQAEQAERIRIAEEQVRIEQEKKAQEIMIAERKEKKKKRRKKAITAIIISLVVIALLGCGTVFFGIPYYKYTQACAALESKEYDVAYNAFIALGDFRDSEEKACEARYQKAKNLLTSDKYQDAYKLFNELGSYQDSSSKKASCVTEWADYILSKSNSSEATKFKNTVTLQSDQYYTIYSKVWSQINNHTSFEYWDDGWEGTKNATVVYTMLQTLPSSYEDVDTLIKLFKVLSNGDIHPVADYIRNNMNFLEAVWSIDFIQDFCESDDMISYFLEGYWSTYDGDYYFNFYENDEGGSTCSYNLPHPDQPSGTKYYNIKDLIWVWEDANNKELAKVFRITINSFDSISVYCYKNNRTYKLYR